MKSTVLRFVFFLTCLGYLCACSSPEQQVESNAFYKTETAKAVEICLQSNFNPKLAKDLFLDAGYKNKGLIFPVYHKAGPSLTGFSVLFSRIIFSSGAYNCQFETRGLDAHKMVNGLGAALRDLGYKPADSKTMSNGQQTLNFHGYTQGGRGIALLGRAKN